MDLSNTNTAKNLESAFGGESMANRKYLFFSEVAKQLGFKDISKLFKETANQETEHAFAHFRLMHPELVVTDASKLSEAEKKQIISRCLELAIEGETYEYTTMYPEFAAEAQIDRDEDAKIEFEEQETESKQHAAIFRKAAQNFGFLTSIENHHANEYSEALAVLDGEQTTVKTITDDPTLRKWICRQCSMIYDPLQGDPDSGIAPGTVFEDIPDDWYCPICGAEKKLFIPYQ